MLKIISLGNELRGDDGIGPRVLEQLAKIKHPIPIRFINAGADAFIILEHLVDSDPVLLIDCAKMGKTPGSVNKFNVMETSLGKTDNAIALHGFSFAEMLDLAKIVGEPAPCTVLGIEPKSMQMGNSLSEEVKQSIPKAINLILEEIDGYANGENFNN